MIKYYCIILILITLLFGCDDNKSSKPTKIEFKENFNLRKSLIDGSWKLDKIVLIGSKENDGLISNDSIDFLVTNISQKNDILSFIGEDSLIKINDRPYAKYTRLGIHHFKIETDSSQLINKHCLFNGIYYIEYLDSSRLHIKSHSYNALGEMISQIEYSFRRYSKKK